MIRKLILGTLTVAMVSGSLLATTGAAEARRGRNGAFAAGAAAGVLGGVLLGSALSSRPAYAEEPTYYYDRPQRVYVQPEPRCYIRKQQVRNTYDRGYHIERVRVCDDDRY